MVRCLDGSLVDFVRERSRWPVAKQRPKEERESKANKSGRWYQVFYFSFEEGRL